jgi:hypothetical protein
MKLKLSLLLTFGLGCLRRRAKDSVKASLLLRSVMIKIHTENQREMATTNKSDEKDPAKGNTGGSPWDQDVFDD